MEIYQKKLVESGHVSKEDVDRIKNKVLSILNEEFVASKDYVPQRRAWLSAYWTGFKSPEQPHVSETPGMICFLNFLFV